MIDPRELKLGNYIFDEEGCFIKITGFQPHGHITRCDEPEGCILLFDIYSQDGKIREGYENESDSCNPIPLTPEWLERCGEKCDRPDWQYQIQVGALKWYFRWNAVWYSELGGIYLDSRFKYVHQVQNLYFLLIGKELKIKSFNQSN